MKRWGRVAWDGLVEINAPMRKSELIKEEGMEKVEEDLKYH